MAEGRVVRLEPEDATPIPGSEATAQVLVGPAAGSERLLQRILRFPPGTTGSVGHPGADDVLYVAHGEGLLVSNIRDERHDLMPGSAALVPAKVPAYVANLSRNELELVSSLSPPPFDGFFTADARDVPLTVLHEEEREWEPAGENRRFKVLAESQHMTQFLGVIGRSHAPPHIHTHEETIYILGGQGRVHLDHRGEPIRPGTSVFLPPGTQHSLENEGPDELKLLGVFSPPGSPAAKREGAAPVANPP